MNRTVTLNQGIEKASKYKCLFLEVSAKEGTRVKELFQQVTNPIVNEGEAPDNASPANEQDPGRNF